MEEGSTVHIIGVGCICGAGANLDGCMESMLAGKGTPTAPTQFLCEQNIIYPVFEVSDGGIAHNAPVHTRTVHLLLTAVEEALESARLSPHHLSGFRLGVCIGTSVGASLNFLDFYRQWRNGDAPGLAPIERYLASNPAEAVARRYGIQGPCQTVVNACTSGTDAIGTGASWIRQGLCDLVIAGGADELSEISYNGFARLMITSAEPCRPFDKERKGLNLGEGAAVLLLASADTMDSLGTKQRGQVAGYGTCGDAYHLTAPHPESRGLLSAIDVALKQADIAPKDIGFINVHGTATPANDLVEGAVIRERFPKTLISATKGFTGHTLGAAGAIEAAFTLACLERCVLPPTNGFSQNDPDIGCSPVSTTTSVMAGYGLSQSLAFGGNNSVLIIKGGAV